MDIKQILAELTLEEKAALVAGTDFMYTNPIPRLNVPSIRMSDGPHGLRVQAEGGDNGVSGSEPATAFPTAATVASSWNPENTYKMGLAIADECAHYGIDVLLGPGTNIKRNPLAGRNFEYFSEDPLLSGKMAAAEVRGVQEGGAGVSVKHFALNNTENYRFMGDSVCDMRAIREIYLKPFEIIVKESNPESLMCAYNKINGTYSCQNEWLLTDVLRGEWGFSGLVMTDWGATHDRLQMLRAGLDLEMPGDTVICRKWIVDGIANGTLSESDLDRAVENVLRLVSRHEGKKRKEADFAAHDLLAAEIAADSAVLLKNDGELPLSKTEKYCVVGELFERPRYQGSGSSMINPTSLSTPRSAFDEIGVKYSYAKGYRENATSSDITLINEAKELASGYDRVLVFLGLTDYVESEGADRENMQLPENQLALVDALLKMKKRITVVLFGGSPAELPFADEVSAILNMYLPGQGGGRATAELLFGCKTPSGKLAETWQKSYSDVPFGTDFGASVNEVYKESVLVGYRYYLGADSAVRYPFGYGLSYTSFDYSDIEVKRGDGGIDISCIVKNIGKYDGAEIVQLYVRAPRTDVFKPQKELRGFTKVYLKAGESKRVTINIKEEALRYWNIKEDRYVLESGEYVFELCSDCRTVKLAYSLTLQGDDAPAPYTKEISSIYESGNLGAVNDRVFEEMSGIKIPPERPKLPIRMESRFTDLSTASLMGKILYNAVLGVAKKDMKKAKKLPMGAERDNKIKGALFLQRVLESNSITTMSMSGGKGFPYNFAEGFVDLANGRILKAIKDFCFGIKAPALPKEKEKNK